MPQTVEVKAVPGLVLFISRQFMFDRLRCQKLWWALSLGGMGSTSTIFRTHVESDYSFNQVRA